jgi:hypothetical protein
MIKQRYYYDLWMSKAKNKEHVRQYQRWSYLKKKMHRLLTPILYRRLGYIL